jgi:hypothetical protein
MRWLFQKRPENSPGDNDIGSFDSADSPLRGESAALRMTKLIGDSRHLTADSKLLNHPALRLFDKRYQ